MTAYRGINAYTGAEEPPALPPLGTGAGEGVDSSLAPVSVQSYAGGRTAPGERTGPEPYLSDDLRPVRELIYGGPYVPYEGIRPYRFGVNDQILLRVEGHDELSGKLQVITDGTVELPLVRERIPAIDRTREELKRAIVRSLAKYVEGEPRVELGIDFAAGRYYYVFGEVQTAGRFPMGIRPVTVSEAVFRANSSSLLDAKRRSGTYGGVWEEVGVEERIRAELDTSHRENFLVSQTADFRKIYVITPHRTRPTREIVNVKAILYEGKTGDDRVVKPGQVIFVPSAADTRFLRFVRRVVDPLDAAEELDTTGTHWYNRLR
ncbi:MAG: polysaccharide biosynthesis/export family protein [Planctomycetota bacterium]